jgi:hypothetical protein
VPRDKALQRTPFGIHAKRHHTSALVIFPKRMRNLLIIGCCSVLAALTTGYSIDSTAYRWSWISGAMYDNSPLGVYPNMKNTYADTYLPPSREQHAADYIDSLGIYFVFGGLCYDTDGTIYYLNDLWTYNTSLGQWAWIAGGKLDSNNNGNYGTLGSSSSVTQPGGRTAQAISTPDGIVIFGGLTQHDNNGAKAELNDVWKFTWATNQWTWIAGSSVYTAKVSTGGAYYYGVWPSYNASASLWPSSRNGYCWISSGDGDYAYLSAGYGLYDKNQTNTYGRLNDLWKFDLSTATWTWLSGSSQYRNISIRVDGNYTIKGSEDANTMPRRRKDHACSLDATNQYIYIFGGTSFGNPDVLSDTLRFNLITKNWAYLSGSYLPTWSPGMLDSEGSFNSTNFPSGRYAMGNDFDSAGNLYIYGGLNAQTQSSTPPPTPSGGGGMGPGMGPPGGNGSPPPTTATNNAPFSANPADLWIFNASLLSWARVKSTRPGMIAQYFTYNSSCDNATAGERAYGDLSVNDDGSLVYVYGGFDSRVIWDYSDLWSLQNSPASSVCEAQAAYIWPTQAPTPQIGGGKRGPPPSGAAAVGIVILVLVGVFAIGAVVWWVKKRKTASNGGVAGGAPPAQTAGTQPPSTNQQGPYATNGNKLEFATIDPNADDD